jgi:hypothetical protein
LWLWWGIPRWERLIGNIFYLTLIVLDKIQHSLISFNKVLKCRIRNTNNIDRFWDLQSFAINSWVENYFVSIWTEFNSL